MWIIVFAFSSIWYFYSISVRLGALLTHYIKVRFNDRLCADYLGIYHFVLPYDEGKCSPSQFSHPSRAVSAARGTCCFSSVEERRCRRVYCSQRAPRRTSYPAASGASTLIGSGTRATACATRQLLIGLSGQVVPVTSAPLRTVAAGRWRNSGERHRRTTAAVAARPSPGQHRASRRLGAWMDAGQTSLGVSTWT